MEAQTTKYEDLKSAVLRVLGRGDLPSPTRIREVITRYRAFPDYEVDEAGAERMARELESSLGVSMEIGSVITGKDYLEWLTAAKQNIDPYYWSRYQQLLEQKHFPPKVVAKLDEVTDRILGLLGNPREDGPWDRRGMVVGHVQSGKTANYTGLIAKGADAGYRLIVVIAGIHNNLRNQTQERIDEGFVGKDSARLQSGRMNKFVGVGTIDRTHIPVTLTSSLRDFNKREAETNPFDLTVMSVPIVLVIKKNTSTLKNLINWLKEHNAKGSNDLIDAPMLLIDDEADNASIDISRSPEEASRINSQIRELLKQFKRSCYVGYTATPFANIFIDPASELEMIGADLFPRDFIVGLEAPDNYFGAEKIFSDDASVIREIDDNEDYLPLKHKNGHEVSELPESLCQAVQTFILVRCIRILRGYGVAHNSMLVNASRFTSVQGELRNVIHHYLSNITNHVRFSAAKSIEEALKDDVLLSLHETWIREFSDLEFTWADIQTKLLESCVPVKVVEVNSRSAGTLNYSDYSDTGLNVIAVGGFSLSRGLTLEGLSVSYFLRNSMMYDTLLQMGRWFGYRPGYEDLCRVWMSSEAEGWYTHIAESIEELREEIRRMEKRSQTPSEFGLKVRSHPDTLIVTARNKMGSSESVKVRIGLGNQFIETSTLFKRLDVIEANKSLTKRLVKHLGLESYDRSMPSGNYVWSGVPVEKVTEFIGAFKNHPNSFYTQSEPVLQYIRQRSEDELTRWDVALISTKDGIEDNDLGLRVGRQDRTENRNTVKRNDYLIVTDKQRIADAKMESIGLDPADIREINREYSDERKKAYERENKPLPKSGRFNPPGRKYREKRRRPLLLLHLLSILKPGEKNSQELSVPTGVVGWSISFPATARDEETVEYVVNTTWWKDAYGDDFDEEDVDED